MKISNIVVLVLVCVDLLFAQLRVALQDEGVLYKLVIESDSPFSEAKLHFIDKNGNEVVKETETKVLYLPKNLYTDMDGKGAIESIINIGIEIGNAYANIEVPQYISLDGLVGYNEGNIFLGGKYVGTWNVVHEHNKDEQSLTYVGTYLLKTKEGQWILPEHDRLIFEVYDFHANEWKKVKDALYIENYAFTLGDAQYMLFRADGYRKENVLLQPGWNLVGSLCGVELSRFDENLTKVVWQYVDGEWRGYSPRQEIARLIEEHGFATLDRLRSGGFWVYVDDFTLLRMGECSQKKLHVAEGWNLLGVDEALSPYEFGDGIVWRYVNGRWSVYGGNERAQVCGYDVINTLPSFSGFWLYSNRTYEREPSLIYRNDFECVKGFEKIERMGQKAVVASRPYSEYLGKVALDGLTLSAWVKFDELKEQEIFGFFDGSRYITIFLNYGEATTTSYDGSSRTYGNWNINFKAITNQEFIQQAGFIVTDLEHTKIEKDRWYHIALTVTSDGNYTLYYDGQRVGSASTKVVFPEEYGGYEEYVDIGKIQNAQFMLYKFEGAIDNVEIYNKVLNEDEIQQLR